MLNLPPFCGRVLLILLVLPSFLFGQWEDVSLDHLMPVSTAGSWFGCGISTADFDGDGWDDVTASSVDGRVSLFKGGPDGLSLHQELNHMDQLIPSTNNLFLRAFLTCHFEQHRKEQ